MTWAAPEVPRTDPPMTNDERVGPPHGRGRALVVPPDVRGQSELVDLYCTDDIPDGDFDLGHADLLREQIDGVTGD